MTNGIGIMAMVFGFIGMAIEHYGGATSCFLFAFILWCVKIANEHKSKRKGGE